MGVSFSGVHARHTNTQELEQTHEQHTTDTKHSPGDSAWEASQPSASMGERAAKGVQGLSLVPRLLRPSQPRSAAQRCANVGQPESSHERSWSLHGVIHHQKNHAASSVRHESCRSSELDLVKRWESHKEAYSCFNAQHIETHTRTHTSTRGQQQGHCRVPRTAAIVCVQTNTYKRTHAHTRTH